MSQVITVIGATGNIGRALTARLLENGATVRAVGRGKDELAILAKKGAETRSGELEDVGFVTDALRGTDAAFVMIPPHYSAPDMRTEQRRIGAALTEAIRLSGNKRIVALSSVGGGLPVGTGPILGLHEFENALRSVPGIALTVLRAAYFMENHLGSIGIIKYTGVNGGATNGDTPLPMVATRDIANVAAVTLNAPASIGYRVTEVLGPRDYTLRQATRILGASIGKPDLQYVQFPNEDFKQGLISAGFSASVADQFVEMSESFSAGIVQRTVTRTAANSTPTTLEQFAQEVFAPAFLK